VDYLVFQFIPRPISSRILDDMSLYTHLIFTSKNAVNKIDFPHKTVISIGCSTALHLEVHDCPVTDVASQESQDGLVELMRPMDLDHSYILLPHSSLACQVLEDFLIKRGVQLQVCNLYDITTHKLEPVPDLDQIDEIVFTNPSSVRSFMEIFSHIPDNKILTCIGPYHSTRINKETHMPYKLPDLPYDFQALEPVISGQIMEIHYTKHHQAYVTNLNVAFEKYQEAERKNDLGTMIALQQAIRFNGGGHVNHSIFWTNLAPPSQGGGTPPTGGLAQALIQEFGSFQGFIDKFSSQTIAIQGSGWGWLGLDPSKGCLVMATCANQDPLSTQMIIPLLGIDVWEHAYYLQYKNVRAEYVKNIWNVVNWKNVEERFSNATK